MTDDTLALTLVDVNGAEARIRTHFETTKGADIAEHDMTIVAGRQVTALKRTLETWISARACRAAQRSRGGSDGRR